MSSKLLKLVNNALNEYNKYRYPEAKARILNFKDDELVVKIEGSYVITCGLYDWLEDLIYILEKFNINASIAKIEEPKNPLEGWRIITYKIRYKNFI